jgi:hypothetical protein
LSERTVNESPTSPHGASVDTTICIAQETRRVASQPFQAAVTISFHEQVISEHAVQVVDASPERAAVCGFIYLRPNLKLDSSWTKVNLYRRCVVCADILDDYSR